MLARDTKVYKDTKELLDTVIELVNMFSRVTKYNIGDICIKSCVEMLSCIQMINISEDPTERIPWFKEFIIYEERLRTLMEVGTSKNIGVKTPKRVAHYTSLLVSVGKQMTAWRDSTIKAIQSRANEQNTQNQS